MNASVGIIEEGKRGERDGSRTDEAGGVRSRDAATSTGSEVSYMPPAVDGGTRPFRRM